MNRLDLIVASRIPPSNHHVLWMNTASEDELYSFRYGSWKPIGGIRKINIYALSSITDIKAGSWVDITTSYLEGIDNVRPVYGSSRSWKLSSEDNSLYKNPRYLIQIFDHDSTSFHGEGFVDTRDGERKHFHFTLSRINKDDSDTSYPIEITGNNESPYIYLITNFYWADTNSTFNFDALHLRSLERTLGNIETQISANIGGHWENSYINLNTAEDSAILGEINLDRIINSQIFIESYIPITDPNILVVHSTITNSILCGNTQVSHSEITNSVIGNTVVYNSHVTTCVYAGTKYGCYYEHTSESGTITGHKTPTLSLKDAKLNCVCFIPAGIESLHFRDYSWSHFYSTKISSLSSFPYLTFEGGLSSSVVDGGVVCTNVFFGRFSIEECRDKFRLYSEEVYYDYTPAQAIFSGHQQTEIMLETLGQLDQKEISGYYSVLYRYIKSYYVNTPDGINISEVNLTIENV